MQFNEDNFRELLSTDIWLMENMLKLPSNTVKRSEVGNGNVTMQINESISMSDQQKAVTSFRKKLIPAIFIISQKVYSELFRLVLNMNSLETGNRQYDIEVKITQELSTMINFEPFGSKHTFNLWWHEKYDFDGERVIVKDKKNVLLDWTECEVIKFTQEVLKISKKLNSIKCHSHSRNLDAIQTVD